MTPNLSIRILLWAILPLLLTAGCGSVATKKAFYEPITAELRSGSPDVARQMLEEARENKKYAEKDRLLYFIDVGMLNHYTGNYEESNIKLHLAEAAAEELFTKSISRAVASAILNDNALEYAGEDYEILYANLISALNYMAQDNFEDAFVEIRRAGLKLDLLEQKYADAALELQRSSPDDSNKVEIDYNIDKVRFHNDAFGRYLSMHMYAAENKWDDARIDYDFLVHAFHSQPHIYGFAIPDVKYHSQDKALLSVVGLVGLSPEKQAMNLRIRTDKDLNLIQVLYDDPPHVNKEYGHFPINISEDFYFKFSIPKIVPRPSIVSRIELLIDGVPVGELQLLEDVGRVAEETFAARKSLIYIRSVLRAITKGLAAHKFKEKVDTGGLAGWLKKAAIDVGTDAIENADLRCCQYLPGLIYVGDFEIEAGIYDLSVKFYDSAGEEVAQTTFADYEVTDNGLNLIEVFTVN